MADLFDGIFPEVVKTIRAATSLAAQDINFYHSLDSNLAEKIDKSGKELLDITNQLIASSDRNADTISFGKEKFPWKQVSESLDSIFELADIEFDRSIAKKTDPYTYLEDGTTDSSRALGKTIPKPQLQFKVAVDNSESHPFKPKITYKPHAIIPFEESTKLVHESDSEDPDHYLHPYEKEIDTQPYPDEILKEMPPVPSRDWNSTSAEWVETPEQLQAMISELTKCSEIAVDLEHHDYRTYYGIVCLMQISSRDKDWIVDTIKLRDDLEPLNEVFTDPKIVKVFHGAFMDIIWLQRDLGLYIVSLFDTYHASKKLGFPKFSLAYLLETFANFKTSKKYQLADWRLRPLSPAMLSYARSDTHFLLNIFDQLRNKLVAKGDDSLQEVLYNSRQVAKRRFEYTSFRPLSNIGSKVSCPVMSSNPSEPYSSIMTQYNVPRHKKLLVEALYNWRDEIAKKSDESVRYIMPNQILISLALLPVPIDNQKILGVSSHIPEAVRLHAKDLVKILEDTHKTMAETDWDLVEKLSNTASEDSALNFEDKPSMPIVQSISAAFDKLKSIEKGTSLLGNHSLLLSDILNKNQDFSVEYDTRNHELVRHAFKETKERQKTISDHLSTYNVPVKKSINPVEPVTKIEKVSTIKDEAVKPSEETEVKQTSTKDPFENKNDDELITLRKKSKKHHKTTLKKTEEPVVDYMSGNKILIEDKFQKPVKKRSFNPYAQESEGPQGAKKRKQNTTGKTTVFRKK